MKPCDNCSAPFAPLGGGSRYCKSCKGSTRENRERVSAQKSASPCVDCGQHWPACVMQYDHLPGSVKVGTVSQLVNGPWFLVEREIAKCELVCANCHLIRTFKRGAGKKTSLAGERPTRWPRRLPGELSEYWKRRVTGR